MTTPPPFLEYSPLPFYYSSFSNIRKKYCKIDGYGLVFITFLSPIFLASAGYKSWRFGKE